MVMAEVQQMANTQNGEAFHARFVGVIARIQELLRQSRACGSSSADGASAVATATSADAGSVSDAGSAVRSSRDGRQRRGGSSGGGGGCSQSASGSSDSADGGSSTGSAMAAAGGSSVGDGGSGGGGSRALYDFMSRPAEEVWSQLERNGVSDLQVCHRGHSNIWGYPSDASSVSMCHGLKRQLCRSLLHSSKLTAHIDTSAHLRALSCSHLSRSHCYRRCWGTWAASSSGSCCRR